jgi:hypothetical protein
VGACWVASALDAGPAHRGRGNVGLPGPEPVPSWTVLPGNASEPWTATSKIVTAASARCQHDYDSTAGAGHAIQAPRPDEVPADVAVATCANCPRPGPGPKVGRVGRCWRTALFDRIDVLGMREATVHLSAHAVRHGLAAVLPAEFGIPVSGRGERI